MSKQLHKWVVIHLLPEKNGFRLESRNKMSFGNGFPDMAGYYSGTVNIEPENKTGKLNFTKESGDVKLSEAGPLNPVR